jgi:hypothetical protein
MEIEPSSAFDVRVRARVAAEPKKQGWWAWFALSPRVAFAASMLLLGTFWIATRTDVVAPSPSEEAQINENMPVLENYDVLSEFGALTELPPPAQNDSGAVDQDQNQNQQQNQEQDDTSNNQSM